MRLLQANLNHSRGAQDLFLHTLREWKVALAVAAEPYSVPDHPSWFRDEGGSVAIVRGDMPGAPPVTLLESGRGYLAVQWGEYAVVGLYAPPSRSISEFEELLGGVAAFIRQFHPRPVLVLGDFNAHASAWASPRTDARGEVVLDWAAELELRLVNRGSTATCVRPQGSSIVDLTWASPSAVRRVAGWRVAEEAETLSDHRYIVFSASGAAQQSGAPRPRCPDGVLPPRWALRRLDEDALMAVVHAVDWSNAGTSPVDAREGAEWFRGIMTNVCDVSMPRSRPLPRRAAHWWSRGIAELRSECTAARRQCQRARRRRQRDEAWIAQLEGAYKAKRAALRLAIKEAKAQAWKELLGSLDRDPWGRPYRLVLGRLRPYAPPVTEGLDPQVLGRVVEALFPSHLVGRGGCSRPVPEETADQAWSVELGVTEAELGDAIKKMAARDTAPGPDGIPGKVWALALGVLGPQLRRLFDRCLELGQFPPQWRRGRMVLLKKEGRPADSPSAYRPICLLDEAGKLFERVLASRLVHHLSAVGPDLCEEQYGFRKGRSTLDAIRRVRTLAEAAVSEGGVAIAVSVDIVNAFNTLPWGAVREALRYHRVPPYLQRVLGSYLSDRWIEFPCRYGVWREREVHCGVPQGSVLGPVLWDLAYDVVLRAALPPGVSIVSYADDTLILASGEDWRRTIRLAEVGVACAVARIRDLGLEIAPHKSEALWLLGPRQREPPRSWVRVGESHVRVRTQMKYLGLTLDSHWRFEAHFEQLVPRVERTAAALGRLLPNLGGPETMVRRLYAGVVRSMALYGSPVWANDLMASRRSRALLRRIERRMAIRCVRGYRTTSYAAAMALAGLIPLELQAEVDAELYDRVKALRLSGIPPPEVARWATISKRRSQRRALNKWRSQLQEPANASKRAVGAVLPNFEKWMGRTCGRLTYRVTQVLTGHGCFGEYLRRIGKEATAQCHHCGEEEDTPQHTLEECPAWSAQRRTLRSIVGADLSPPVLVQRMLEGKVQWDAVASFCEDVMSQKEAAERVRERTDPARRALGRGRRRGGASARTSRPRPT
ncbi:Putative 115 kDa protein in type-1 retrotransposable element R1DM [Anthophora quadrimaculata]